MDEDEEFEGAVEEGEMRTASVQRAEKDVDIAEDLKWGAEERKCAEVNWVCDEV